MAIEQKCTQYVRTSVDIYFTGDTVRCSQCPLLETYARKQCRRTGEYLADGYLVGMLCPLVIESAVKADA